MVNRSNMYHTLYKEDKQTFVEFPQQTFLPNNICSTLFPDFLSLAFSHKNSNLHHNPDSLEAVLLHHYKFRETRTLCSSG